MEEVPEAMSMYIGCWGKGVNIDIGQESCAIGGDNVCQHAVLETDVDVVTYPSSGQAVIHVEKGALFFIVHMPEDAT